MEEYCKNLEKQEQQRLAQLERIKAVQARQAEDAKLRLPVKKWVDPALIEKHFRWVMVNDFIALVKVLESERSNVKEHATEGVGFSFPSSHL